MGLANILATINRVGVNAKGRLLEANLDDARFSVRWLIRILILISLVITAIVAGFPDLQNLHVASITDDVFADDGFVGDLTFGFVPTTTAASSLSKSMSLSDSATASLTGSAQTSSSSTQGKPASPATSFVTITVTSLVTAPVSSTTDDPPTIIIASSPVMAASTPTETAAAPTAEVPSNTVISTGFPTPGLNGSVVNRRERDLNGFSETLLDQMSEHPAMLISFFHIRSNDRQNAPPHRILTMAKRIQERLPWEAMLAFLISLPISVILSILPFWVPKNPKLAYLTRYTRVHKKWMQFLLFFTLSFGFSLGVYAVVALGTSVDYAATLAPGDKLIFQRNDHPNQCLATAIALIGLAMLLQLGLMLTAGYQIIDLASEFLHPAVRACHSSAATRSSYASGNDSKPHSSSDPAVPPQAHPSSSPTPSFRTPGIASSRPVSVGDGSVYSQPSAHESEPEEVIHLRNMDANDGTPVVYERQQSIDYDGMWSNTFPRPVEGVFPLHSGGAQSLRRMESVVRPGSVAPFTEDPMGTPL